MVQLVLPPGAAIGGHRLFPSRGLRIGAQPQEAHDHRLTTQGVVGEESAHATLEPADHRHVELMGIGVGQPPDCPCFPRRIEGPDGDGAVIPAWEVQQVVLDIAAAPQDRARLRGAGELFPLLTSDQPLLQAAVPDAPFAELEIEIRRDGGSV